jgi:serine/threonine protein kinase
MLGKGDYGNVYLSTINNLRFAVKLAKLKPGAVERPYSKFNTSWYEVLIMRNILKPLIQKNICPNLPLLIDSFVCDECKLTIRGKTQNQPCVTTITELADGSFRDFLKDHHPTEEELYSALFQIMAGLHAVQLHGQIMNYDVKADNALFYTVTHGGYWMYVIHGKPFYVPNFGKLFVLNDFGISRPLSPDFQLYREPTDLTFRLGSRFGIVKNGKFTKLNAYKEADYRGTMENTKAVKWSDGKSSKGANYRLFRQSQEIINSETKLSSYQKKFLRENNLSDNPLDKSFFLNPEVIPPFEFYNDLQDAVRMFIGGKRTTQRGHHRRYAVVTNKIFKKLKKYIGPGDSLADRKFSTNAAQLLAGYFIERFFTKDRNYTKLLPGKMIGKYVIS